MKQLDLILHRLHKLALAVHRLRYIFLLLALLGFGSGLFAALNEQDIESWQMRLSLVFSLWALMLFAFIQLFHTIPPPLLPKLGFFERLRARLRLLPYQVLALFVVLLSAALILISLKLLML